MSVEIVLTDGDQVQAILCATFRMVARTAAKSDPQDYVERSWGSRWADHLIGACGEAAYARHRGVHWSPTLGYKRKEPDFPPDVEIRTVRKPNDPLPIRRDDVLDRWFVLVVAEPAAVPSRVRIVGGIRGSEGIRVGTVADPGGKGHPACFVPQGELIAAELHEANR